MTKGNPVTASRTSNPPHDAPQQPTDPRAGGDHCADPVLSLSTIDPTEDEDDDTVWIRSCN